MLKEVSCTPLPNTLVQSEASPSIETKPGKQHFVINGSFKFTWIATLDDLQEGEQLMDTDEDNLVDIDVPSFKFVIEQRILLNESYGPTTISNVLYSSVGLPPKDHPAIANKILSCARELAQGGTRAESLGMKLFVACHLENPSEAKTVKDALFRSFDTKALKRVKAEEGAQAEGEVVAKKCSICLEDMVLGTMVTKLPCSHVFHNNCITPWLLKGANCPECRYDPVMATCGGTKFINYLLPEDS